MQRTMATINLLKMLKGVGFVFFCLILNISSKSQSDSTLLSMLDDEPEKKEYEQATFKATRIINSQSIENVYKGVLDFRIAHRFGALNGGGYTLFGLDQASMKINLDYGLTKRLAVGFGRSNVEKTYDVFMKLKILRQQTTNRMPISLSIVSGTSMNSLKWTDPNRNNYFTSRLTFFHQILIARKFNKSFSLQMMPSLVHYNMIVNNNFESNDHYFLGVGFRQKLTKRMSVNFEYTYSFNKPQNQTLYNSMSVGIDLETGGHVFQLQFTNSNKMHERGFLAETSESWLKGGIHFGFNISRVFTIKSYN